jgi:CHAD domain-containing protein
LRTLLTAQTDALAAHEPGAVDGSDPEELKRFRVATRRLRALLRAGRPLVDETWSEGLRAELAWLGSTLGPARDLDVLIGELRATARHFEPGEQYGLALMFRRLDDEREAARSALGDCLRSERYLALRGRLLAEIPTLSPVETETTLFDLAAREFRKLDQAARALHEHPYDEELHDLRLRVKRSRYAAELAATEVGEAAEAFVRRAKAVQDVLGEHQDASVAEARIRMLLHRPQSVRWAIAAGRLIERQHVRRQSARAAFPGAWADLRRQGLATWRSPKQRRSAA